MNILGNPIFWSEVQKSAHLQSFKNLLIMNCQSILFVLSLWDTTFKFLKRVLLDNNHDLYMTNAFFNTSWDLF